MFETIAPRRLAELAVLPVLLLLSLTGCSVTQQARKLALRGYECYKAGRYEDACLLYDEFLQRHGHSDGASEVHYLRALTRLRLGEPDAAEEDFRSAISKPVRRPEVEAMARIGLANLAYERRFIGSVEKQTASRRLALEHYGKALKLLADRPPKAAVLYRLAVIEQELGNWEQARRHLSRIFRLIHSVESFKKSALEQPALRRFRAKCFFIQAGVFKTRRNARGLQAKLRQAKLPARIEYAQTSPLLYSVRVGRYNTYAQALEHLSQVRRFVADAVVGPAP